MDLRPGYVKSAKDRLFEQLREVRRYKSSKLKEVAPRLNGIQQLNEPSESRLVDGDISSKSDKAWILDRITFT